MTSMGGTRHLEPADALPAAVPAGLVAAVRGAAASELARRLGPSRLFTPSEDDRALVWAVISERLADAHREYVLAGNTPLDEHARQRVARAVFDALLGLGPLERHLAGDDVEELLVNGHQRAFVVRAGGAKDRVETGFGSEAELRAFAARTVAVAGRRLDEANPKADARLPDGSRLHVICPPLAPFTCLTIRRHRLLAHSIDDLLALGTLTPQVAGLLGAAVRAGLNLLISGGTGSGKTTTLNAVASQIPTGQRVITIEETKELALARHLEDCVGLESRFANLEGVGEIRIRELLRQALRMRPQRIIVGEVRGPEALDMLNAMNSGHEGSMGTIHANSARQALAKLHTYTKMASEHLADDVVAGMIAQTIDLVCQLRLHPDGRRVLTEVVEVAGVEAGRVLANQLLRPDPDGTPRFTGLRPQAAERLQAAGWDPPAWPPASSLAAVGWDGEHR
jgi:pilus assembly protein CpaF